MKLNQTITSYSGTNFINPIGITSASSNGVTYIYVTDWGEGEIIKLHQNGSFVKSVGLTDAVGITSSTNEIFVSNYNLAGLFKYDLELNFISSISVCSFSGLTATQCLSKVQGLYFNFNSSLLYAADVNNKVIHVFYSSLFRIDYINFFFAFHRFFEKKIRVISIKK